MNAPRVTTLLAALFIVAPTLLAAQEDTLVASGERVRVTAPGLSSNPIVGTFDQVNRDTLLLSIDGRAEPISVPISSVSKLEVSAGTKSNFAKGLGIGFLIGATTGALIGAASGDDDPSAFMAFTAEEKAVGAGLVLGLAGGLLGGIIGAVNPSERWEAVPVDELRIEPSPHVADAVALVASIKF